MAQQIYTPAQVELRGTSNWKPAIGPRTLLDLSADRHNENPYKDARRANINVPSHTV